MKLTRSQSTTPRLGDEADKASVVHFKDAILPASDDETDLEGLHTKLKASFYAELSVILKEKYCLLPATCHNELIL